MQGPIAVVGSHGQVARALVAAGAAQGLAVASRGRPDVDITSRGSLAAFLRDVRPAVVVNAAAYTAVDKAESEPAAAFAANADGPGHLAELTAALGVPLIHLSTDYVFDGQATRPYREDDAIAPASVYGQSKARGEAAVRLAQPRQIILRTAWVYDAEGTNFLRTMLRLGAQRDEIGVVDDQTGSPTYAIDIATAILAIAGQMVGAPAGDGRWGTYHLTNTGTTTWAGFARAIFEAAGERGFKTARVRSITTAEYPTPARRPAYSVLDTSRITSTFALRLPSWEDGLARCVAALPEPDRPTTPTGV